MDKTKKRLIIYALALFMFSFISLVTGIGLALSGELPDRLDCPVVHCQGHNITITAKYQGSKHDIELGIDSCPKEDTVPCYLYHERIYFYKPMIDVGLIIGIALMLEPIIIVTFTLYFLFLLDFASVS